MNYCYMAGIAEIGASLFQASERRLETISQNISNLQTPGYQALKTFQIEIGPDEVGVSDIFNRLDNLAGAVESFLSLEPGELKPSEANLSFALSGPGYFALRDNLSDETVFDTTRNGVFQLSEDGFVIDSRGWHLQSSEGQDMRLRSEDVFVQNDGTVLEQGRPIDRIGIFSDHIDPNDASSLPELVSSEDVGLRQNMVETGNVSLPEEMIEMMQVIRQAETGSRILQTYDTLMGQAISTFGRGR